MSLHAHIWKTWKISLKNLFEMSKNLVYLDEMDSKLNRKLLELDNRKAARDCLNL